MSEIAVASESAGILPARARTGGGGGLGRYLVIRFLLIIPTVFILVTLVFVLMRTTGDPITAAQGGRLPPDQLAERIHAAGYDRPLIVQYGEYLGGLLRGDFGTTISDNRPVTTVLVTYGAATLELAVYGLIVALLVGIPLGMLAAYVRDRWGDAVLRLLRGEDLELVSRSLGVTAATLSGCRDAFLAAGEASLATRPTDGEALQSERLKAKLGEMLLERELLEHKVAALEAGRPLARRRSKR